MLHVTSRHAPGPPSKGCQFDCNFLECMHFLPLDICIMPMLTVRNISEEVHRALRLRAVQHGRSTEAEVRAILEEAVKPDGRVKLGSLLAQIGRQAKITGKEAALFHQRDTSAAAPPRFE
ncbi:hypothetical protein LMG1873_02132 [Achromobacter piechaudii]|uniref:Antitoxin FitA-like ribbon-helix-helix domain-containing protein n=2 Tax=Achromobacter piechaudii TaxID=72556 RepID=A0ABN7F097_9BURK|nr:hypothetical protein LMG1873_02132 [Achromobacter piechaudii]CAB3861351.1 hypothetical protein LMG2828_02488 [Achromobacter piechaudii]CAB3949489.1 hypothetical protein LMG6103_02252 [Achromobacter piechaudii]